MKTDWDYSLLADAYLKRPDYSDTAIDAMLAITGLRAGKVCDRPKALAEVARIVNPGGWVAQLR